MTPRGWIRIGAVSGIAGVAWDITSLAVLTWLAGVAPVHDYLSLIALTSWAPWYIAAGTVGVLLHLPFVAALWLEGRGPRHVLALLLGSFFVLQWVAAAAFPCDPGCALVTPTGIVHYVLGIVSFVCLAAATLGYGIAFRATSRAVLPTTLAALALALALLVADLTDTYRGLVERLALLAFGAWSLVIASALLRSARRPGT